MHLSRLFALVALLAFVCSTGVAQETSVDKSGEKCAQCPSSGQCPHADTLTSAQQEEGSCSECPIMTAAMAKLPKMTYKVGDEETCCSESAAAIAKKSEMPVHFVVATKAYDDESAAYTALVEETETFVNGFVTPCKCETSGATTVAGKSCDCPVTSAKLTESVKTAVDAVTMTYKVGDESCGCPNQAAAMAKAADAKTEFVVGDQTTCCEMTARMNLAHAKYKAAVAAINSAEPKVEAGSDS